MVIPSTFEGIIEGVSERIPEFKLSAILSQCKFQTYSVSNLFPDDFHKTFNNVSNTIPK